jgi:hypothetical protein
MAGVQTVIAWVAVSDREFIEVGFEIAFATKADNLFRDLATLEYEHRGNGADPIVVGHRWEVVNVQFADLDSAVVVIGKFFEDGTEHLAGSTPLRPEIHQDRHGGIDDEFFKIAISECEHVGRSHTNQEKNRILER